MAAVYGIVVRELSTKSSWSLTLDLVPSPLSHYCRVFCMSIRIRLKPIHSLLAHRIHLQLLLELVHQALQSVLLLRLCGTWRWLRAHEDVVVRSLVANKSTHVRSIIRPDKSLSTALPVLPSVGLLVGSVEAADVLATILTRQERAVTRTKRTFLVVSSVLDETVLLLVPAALVQWVTTLVVQDSQLVVLGPATSAGVDNTLPAVGAFEELRSFVDTVITITELPLVFWS